MICQSCRVVIPDGMHFCPVCGKRLLEKEVKTAPRETIRETAQEEPEGSCDAGQTEQEHQKTQPETPGMLAAETGTSRRAARKKRWIPVTVILALMLCAGLVLLGIHNGKQRRYNEGVTQLEAGNYTEAQGIFADLGAFDDSAAMAEYSANMARYASALARFDEGDYSGAKDAFLALGAFRDAPEQAQACQNSLSYQNAENFFTAGQYAEAMAAFLALGEFRDAAAKADECDRMIKTAQADALYAQGDFTAALPLYEALSSGGDPEAAEKLAYCQGAIAYAEAESLLNAGKNYDAYLAFLAISDFDDASSRAENCIQPFPKTGELYHNEAYGTRSCSLTIRTPDDEISHNFMKIYSESGELVSTVAIASGASAKIWLPSGSYRMKNAYGEEWFGEEDLFGDDGVYNLLKNGSGDNELFRLEKNYAYTLSLRTSNGGGDDVNTESEDRGSF
ncbi:MAG: hypothetical protein VB062_07505 [Christensenella sp.]|nr:hypothetical protein [Christensenella sp.]